MTINSICEFIFEAFKRDSQLAALLVKTTKLLPSLFDLLTNTLDNVATFKSPDPTKNSKIPIRNRGLLTIFIDKVTKLLHISLLHPREYSVDLIGKFLTDRPLDDMNEEVPRNWLLIIKMFRLIGSQHSSFFYGHIDVKLAICRFVAELLIRLPSSNFLDETVRKFNGSKYMDTGFLEDNNEIDTYGSLLLVEFGQVFRALYVDQRDSRQSTSLPRDLNEHENSKIDVCLCLAILVGSSESAKTTSI